MGKVYIGIDPGADGYMAVITEDGYHFVGIDDSGYKEVAAVLADCIRGGQCVAVIEDVHAVFGSSAKGTFNFGYSKGVLVGLLIALQIPYVLVPPKEWQVGVWVNADKEWENKERKKVNTKATSLNAARRLFPTVDLRRTEKCKKPHDGKVDALLMAEYARRKNF